MISLIVIEPWFNIFRAYERLTTHSSLLGRSDTTIIKDSYQNAVNTLKDEVDQQSCFYTLTNEGIWYYLFDKPSCSKFFYTFYAKPKSAQKLVVEQLESEKP